MGAAGDEDLSRLLDEAVLSVSNRLLRSPVDCPLERTCGLAPMGVREPDLVLCSGLRDVVVGGSCAVRWALPHRRC